MTETKSKHSAKSDIEESNTSHKMCKRKQNFTTVESDCQASQFTASASVKVKHAKADRQSGGMACLEVEVKSDRKEKRHKEKKKKKTSVDDTVDERVKTVSSKSHKRHAKMLKDKDSVYENDEPTMMKFSVGDNTEENALSSSTSLSSVKRKSGKKRKVSADDNSQHDEHASEGADTAVAGSSVKKEKKKLSQDAGEDKTGNLNTEPVDSAAASSSRYRALQYLRTWKSSRDSWTFQKVRQVWLLQHMYDPVKVTAGLTILPWNL